MDELVSKITKEIESTGAKIENIEILGRKDFAYTPRNISGAHYVSYKLTSEPEGISKIKEKLALNDSVYLNQFNRVVA